MADSLVIADQIELLGGGVASKNPLCPGAVFRLGTGFDFGAPQPAVNFLVSMILDGDLPVGSRTANRTPSLPIVIQAPDRFTLAAARELLLKTINAATWTLTWTRDPGNGVAMPMILDCYRANPSTPAWSLTKDRQLASEIQINFQAAPFGRSDTPNTVPVAAPLAGVTAAPSPVVVDTFSSVSSTNFVTSTRVVKDTASAHYDPSIAPLSDPTGNGNAPGAKYTKTGLSLDFTGRTAFSFWSGFGTDYFSTWSGGPVVFACTLTDNAAHTISFGTTETVAAGNSSTSPTWGLITAAIPQGQTFNYNNVTGYTITATNRGANTLRYTHWYINHVAANPPSLQLPSQRGAMYQILGVKGTARTPASFQFQQTATTGTPTTVTLPGPAGTPQQWTAPLGVSTVDCDVIAPGGNGGNRTVASGQAGGGGGGEQARETALAVTALSTYTYNLGLPGDVSAGGVDAFFQGNSVTVTAHRGASVANNTSTGGAAGTGSTNTAHHNGGAGANGGTGSQGGGGGSSGGDAAAGNAGSGVTGGAAVSPGGAGGNGAAVAGTFGNSGKPGAYPGGGGGGATSGTFVWGTGNPGGAGGGGRIQLTYTPTINTYSTLLVHSPREGAPSNLIPYIALDPSDLPNGTIEYPFTPVQSGQPANLDGTYTLMAVASSFNSPSSARDLTITVNQYEYPGGPVYATSVKRAQFTPANDVAGSGYTGISGLNGIVVVGELTLPLKDVPAENTSAYYTATVLDSNTSDDWEDLILLDTQGQTLLINVPTANAYFSYWYDEPSADRGIGRVLGSDFDRSAAVSVADFCPIISGGPIYLNPGDNNLFVYSPQGQPSLSVTYFDRYWLDRIA